MRHQSEEQNSRDRNKQIHVLKNSVKRETRHATRANIMYLLHISDGLLTLIFGEIQSHYDCIQQINSIVTFKR